MKYYLDSVNDGLPLLTEIICSPRASDIWQIERSVMFGIPPSHLEMTASDFPSLWASSLCEMCFDFSILVILLTTAADSAASALLL